MMKSLKQVKDSAATYRDNVKKLLEMTKDNIKQGQQATAEKTKQAYHGLKVIQPTA